MPEIATQLEYESPQDFGTSSKEQATRWHVEIRLGRKELEPYQKRCSEVIRRYRDEKSETFTRSPKRFNILWSNIQTLQPAIYSQTPKPQVDRRYKDRDPIGRLASQTLERVLSFLIQPETFDAQMKKARDDYLLTARGQVWLRYVPSFKQEKVSISVENFAAIPDGAEILDEDPPEVGQYYMQDRKDYEEVIIDNINRVDFLHSPARCLEEVRWVARRHYYRRDEMKKLFSKQAGGLLTKEEINDIPLNFTDSKAEEETDGISVVEQEAFKKAEVWEVWDKETRQVCWVCEDCDYILKKQEDPLKLSGFFPCPKPLYGTLTDGTLEPVPDYILYKDQAKELDDLTTRIALLVESISVRGGYDASCEGVANLLTKKAENKLIPITGFPRHSERGGFRGVIDFLPIETSASVLNILYQSRETTKQEVYEITGISDIVRGASHPRETAAAQQTKAQFATTRLQERQTKMQQFARDIIAMTGEIVAEQFDETTMYNMGGVALLPSAEKEEEFQAMFKEAVKLLRDEATRSFRIDIETDSTIAINREMEKKARVEAVAGIGRFIREAKELSTMSPALMPFATRLLMFATRSFKGGRNLESPLEDAMEAVEEETKKRMAQPPQPPPEVQKAQAEMKMAQEKQQHQLNLKNQEHQQKMQQQAAELDMRERELAIKERESAEELDRKRAELDAELEMKQQELAAELALKEEEVLAEIELERMKAAQKAAIESEQMGLKAEKQREELNGKKPRKKVAKFTTDASGDRIAVVEEIIEGLM